MNVKLCILVILAGCDFGMSWRKGQFEKYGLFRMVLYSPFITCVQNRSLDLDVSGTYIHFYDFSKNIAEIYPINNASKHILDIKSLDKNRKFVIYVGGFRSQINKNHEKQLRDAYKTYPNSYLIIPDHSTYTSNARGYDTAVTHVHYIGKALGVFLAKLKKGGVSFKNIHCVGHSLGAQMLGHTGETFFNLTGKKIARVTALDPAGPCYTNNFIHEQVRSGIAKYVEVYHCNSGGLGSSSILGDVDFIINKKGESQPNCGTSYIPELFLSMNSAFCAHRTCIDIWTASVKNKDLFPAYRCDSYSKFKKGRCTKKMTIAGAWSPLTAKGIYYLSTKNYNLQLIK